MATPAENTWLQLLDTSRRVALGLKLGSFLRPNDTTAAQVVRNFAAKVFLPLPDVDLATVGGMLMDTSVPAVGNFISMFVSDVLNLSKAAILSQFGDSADTYGVQLEEDLVAANYLTPDQTLNPNDDLFPSSTSVGADFLAFDASAMDDGGSGSLNETDEAAFKSEDHDYGFKELREMLNESPATASLDSRASSPLDAMVNNQSALLAQCLASCTSVGSAETNIFPPQENQQPLVVAVASNQF